MLLITRRTGEAVVINGDIIVKVLEVRGGRVKLGCEYPAGSSVFRQELFDKIREENVAAAGVAPGKAKPEQAPGSLAHLLQNVGRTNKKEQGHAEPDDGKPRRDGDEPAE